VGNQEAVIPVSRLCIIHGADMTKVDKAHYHQGQALVKPLSFSRVTNHVN